MKQYLKYFSYSSLIINVLFIATWIIVFNMFSDQGDRNNVMRSILPGDASGVIYCLAFILLTIVSIVGFAQSNSTRNKSLLVVQVLFLGLFVFGIL